MSDHKRLRHKYILAIRHKRWIGITFVALFAFLGIYLLFKGSAAVPTLSLEAEKGTLAKAVVATDPTASDGRFIDLSGSSQATTNKIRLGIATGTPYLPDGMTQTQYWDKIKELGVGWVRTDMLVSNYSDVKAADAVISQAKRIGVKLIMTVSYSYGGLGVDPNDGHSAPQDPQAWADYVGGLAYYWEATAPGTVKAIEIWNEPNLSQFWTNVDPVAYADLLRRSYKTIKAGVPHMVVLSAGLSPGGSNWDATVTSNQNPATFLKKVYEYNNGSSNSLFDAVGYHPYETGVKDQINYSGGPPGGGYHGTHFVRQVMNQFGDQSKQIWGTEAGWPSCVNYGSSTMTEEQRSFRFKGDLKDWFYGVHDSTGKSTGQFSQTSDWNTGPFMIFKLYKNTDSTGLGLIYANNTCTSGSSPSGYFEPQIIQDIKSFAASPRDTVPQ
jgi:hypothetical protein